MSFLEELNTRWTKFSSFDNHYRLSCAHPICSLSCANLKRGKLSVTSIHGTERHSYEFNKDDMTFATVEFLKTLSKKELKKFFEILRENLDM